jgi:hypothetical protein
MDELAEALACLRAMFAWGSAATTAIGRPLGGSRSRTEDDKRIVPENHGERQEDQQL